MCGCGKGERCARVLETRIHFKESRPGKRQRREVATYPVTISTNFGKRARTRVEKVRKKDSRAAVLTLFVSFSWSRAAGSAIIRGFSYVPPEISMKSMPAAAMREICVSVSSTESEVEASTLFILMPMQNDGLVTARMPLMMRRTTSVRFSGVPPKASVRRLVRGERNCASR
jgi:hypothetical protein